jgi:hypothetical protein
MFAFKKYSSYYFDVNISVELSKMSGLQVKTDIPQGDALCLQKTEFL